VVKETGPEGVFQTGVDFTAGTATNGSPTTDESVNLFDPARMDDGSDAFGTAVPLAGVASLAAGASAVFFEDTGGLDWNNGAWRRRRRSPDRRTRSDPVR
jgi:hypothetical protein